MDKGMRQGFGLLVVAALGGLVWVLAWPGDGLDESKAAQLIGMAGAFTALVCAVVGLVLLALSLLRD